MEILHLGRLVKTFSLHIAHACVRVCVVLFEMNVLLSRLFPLRPVDKRNVM